MARPKKFEIELSAEAKNELMSMSRSRTLGAGVVRRAKIVLASAGGESNSSIARRLRTSVSLVGHWRRRYAQFGIAGLYDGVRAGRPRSHDDERIAQMINTVLQSQPKGATHWSVRSVAEHTGISKSTVHRVFQLFGLQPHRTKSFKLSTDEQFVEKVRDIVGLYLNPPDKALVLCVDEKSQVQALERTQPVLPMGLGYLEGVTHDYFRHGTTTLFAALDVASGQVLTQCKAHHRHQEFLAFLKHIETAVPADLDVHLIIDNYCTHKHAKVRSWLAQRPRFHVHYTPTYSSWLNQVERWFGLITQQAIRRGSFKSVKDLIQKIDTFVQNYNSRATPFAWTATADSILKKIERLCAVISGTRH
jgi:putative transposase